MTKNENKIIKQALSILESRAKNSDATLNNADSVRKYLTLKLAELEHEVFIAIYMNTRLQVIEFNEMFRGTIDGASVYPREVVKQALKVNASAVIFAHNHPSQVAEPSQADQQITKRLRDILELIEVRVIDHFVIGGSNIISFSERGLL